jgi:hypothetical protein
MVNRAAPISASRKASDLNARLLSLADQEILSGGDEGFLFPDYEVMEATLLMPRGQAAALERAANRQGLTAGRLIRRLLQSWLSSDGR